MSDTARLLYALDFKREVMVQLPLVSTLLAAVAMTVAAVILSAGERSRLRGHLLVALGASTLVFILATVLSAMILPAMKQAGPETSAGRIEGLITISRVAVWAVAGGILVLFASIGASGFLYSRAVGLRLAATAGAVIVLFLWACFYLDAVMGR